MSQPSTPPADPRVFVRRCQCGCGAIVAGIHDTPEHPATESPLYRADPDGWEIVTGPVRLGRCKREQPVDPREAELPTPEREACIDTLTRVLRDAGEVLALLLGDWDSDEALAGRAMDSHVTAELDVTTLWRARTVRRRAERLGGDAPDEIEVEARGRRDALIELKSALDAEIAIAAIDESQALIRLHEVFRAALGAPALDVGRDERERAIIAAAVAVAYPNGFPQMARGFALLSLREAVEAWRVAGGRFAAEATECAGDAEPEVGA